jgi:hypothetical protein
MKLLVDLIRPANRDSLKLADIDAVSPATSFPHRSATGQAVLPAISFCGDGNGGDTVNDDVHLVRHCRGIAMKRSMKRSEMASLSPMRSGEQINGEETASCRNRGMEESAVVH